MTGFTPRPWEATEMFGDTYWVHEQDSVGVEGKLMAETYYGATTARLIAAAPDLLNAAKTFVATADKYAPRFLLNDLAPLRAAIAKAEGREQ